MTPGPVLPHSSLILEFVECGSTCEIVSLKRETGAGATRRQS
jgi:hypothetical protein